MFSGLFAFDGLPLCHPQIVESDLEGRYDYRPYGGESVADVKARVIRFLQSLPLSQHDTIIVVTHRGIIRVLYDLYPIESGGGQIVPASTHIFRVTTLPSTK